MEVLVSASNKVLEVLDVFHNQALHLITGAILYNRLTRLPNISFWHEYDLNRSRNLKTQKGLIQRFREITQYNTINDKDYELLSYINPLEFMALNIILDLTLNVRKNYLFPTALCAIALEAINTCYPPVEGLHIYTDGSLLDFTQGTGVFCDLFSFYSHVGSHATHYDDEIEAIHLALH
ncbi:hypothetical protein TNCV_504341 [Trichonephila clavipes]|nr:hypothetical protein TNCV_504341 [Trichonephila clavipes]